MTKVTPAFERIRVEDQSKACFDLLEILTVKTVSLPPSIGRRGHGKLGIADGLQSGGTQLYWIPLNCQANNQARRVGALNMLYLIRVTLASSSDENDDDFAPHWDPPAEKAIERYRAGWLPNTVLATQRSQQHRGHSVPNCALSAVRGDLMVTRTPPDYLLERRGSSDGN
ncbi:hypothetical protein H4Q26_015865 [Puccinia striiformis f. sp. tritici PST-130]|nr:hypothetical protein H4Q26_015865 [Puccinia striiformis f. sp. tritici PST-130]